MGADVWIMNIDGGGARPLLKRKVDNVFYSAPWLDAARNTLDVQRNTGAELTVERVDLATGLHTRIADHAIDPALAPDGRTIVYVRFEPTKPAELWRVAVDGSGARPLLTTGDAFTYMRSPRFSPDGRQVVFSAAGRSLRPASAQHLGIPSNLYVASADGTGLQDLGFTPDDVTPAWSADGTLIAYAFGGALTAVDARTGALSTIARDDRYYGDLVWLR